MEPDAPGYRATGSLHVLDLQGAEPRLIAETVTPGLCQGSVWTRDERHIVLQCAGSRTIELYRFDPRAPRLERVSSISVTARPGAMAGRTTR